MKKYYISGSSGFIGSYLTKRFPKRNVVKIPRSILYNPQKEFFEDCDYLYYCAAYGNMAHQDDPQQIILANIIATHELLMATKDIPYKAFVYLSSSSVYGVKNHPMHETNSLEATDYYGVSKICAELLIRAFVKKYNKPVIIARPFSVYGPGEADFRFIPTMIRCIKKYDPMKLAPGMHDWVYIDDVIDALILLQESAEIFKGKAINIGTGIQYDNYDVMKKLCNIAKLLNPNILPIEHIQTMRSYDTWVADNTLLKSLGWLPKHSLSEGLEKVWNSMKE